MALAVTGLQNKVLSGSGQGTRRREGQPADVTTYLEVALDLLRVAQHAHELGTLAFPLAACEVEPVPDNLGHRTTLWGFSVGRRVGWEAGGRTGCFGWCKRGNAETSEYGWWMRGPGGTWELSPRWLCHSAIRSGIGDGPLFPALAGEMRGRSYPHGVFKVRGMLCGDAGQ